jgi:signal peptidase I
MKSVMSTLFRGSAIIIWSVVVLYVVSLLTLRFLGFQTTIVMSNSMSPILQVGDVVLLEKKNKYQVGDVVQFSRGELFYLHRIVQETEDGFRTQGDANPIPDFLEVRKSDIQGEAKGVFRKLGYPLFQFRSFVGNLSHAAFTSQRVTSATAHSRFWQNPTMSWSIISGSGSISFTSPNGVTFLNSGSRTIQSSITSNALVKIYLEGRLTQKDTLLGGFYLSTHTCLNTLSRPTCGWVIQFDDNAKAVKLYTYQSTGALSQLLASGSYSSSLSQNRKFIIEVSPARIFVKLENDIVLNITNPQVVASNKNAQIPSGTRILLNFTGDNRFNANKLVIW